MDFGETLKALKRGRMAYRSGWNGKGMHIYLEDAHSYKIKGGVFAGETRRYEPVICMWVDTKQSHQPGWLASQADMLAEDWELVTQ